MKRQTDEEQLEEKDDFSTIYGDMITFVAVLFILLFVMVYNKQENEAFFEQMNVQFGAENVEQKNQVVEDSKFVSKVQGYIQDEELNQYVQVLVDEQKIRLIMNDPILFEPGSATLKPSANKVLHAFASIIRKVKNPVVIEGHTDSIPPGRGAAYRTNWELSFQRSYSVLKFLLDEAKLSPKQLSVKGFGEHHPLASNRTRKGRAQNRRVEINIIRVTAAEANENSQ